jgi:hypothetical protein
MTFLQTIARVRAEFDAGALHDWQVYENRSGVGEFNTEGNSTLCIIVLPAEGSDWVEVSFEEN